MKLGELLEQLGSDEKFDDGEYEYEIKVEQPHSPQEGNYSVEGVRWEHHKQQIVLELGDD